MTHEGVESRRKRSVTMDTKHDITLNQIYHGISRLDLIWQPNVGLGLLIVVSRIVISLLATGCCRLMRRLSVSEKEISGVWTFTCSCSYMYLQCYLTFRSSAPSNQFQSRYDLEALQ